MNDLHFLKFILYSSENLNYFCSSNYSNGFLYQFQLE